MSVWGEAKYMLGVDTYVVNMFSNCLCAGGKSAILTGLIVALGGNAQATNRGSSLKGFVKEGERYTLQLKGKNC